jgi:hypothetical protein
MRQVSNLSVDETMAHNNRSKIFSFFLGHFATFLELYFTIIQEQIVHPTKLLTLF